MFNVYIQDQKEIAHTLPDNAVLGHAVIVTRNGKQIDGKWCRTAKDAEKMAQQYHTDELNRINWNKKG